MRTFTNTDGWGNKLVTIFARHLDCFIMTIKFSIIYKTRDFRLLTDATPEQLSGSPGFAKIAPYPPCTVTSFWPAYRRVSGSWPDAVSGNVYYHNRRAVSNKALKFLIAIKHLELKNYTQLIKYPIMIKVTIEVIKITTKLPFMYFIN